LKKSNGGYYLITVKQLQLDRKTVIVYNIWTVCVKSRFRWLFTISNRVDNYDHALFVYPLFSQFPVRFYILQISNQVRRKPWNQGPIRRFFGREFQVFIIKSTAKASDEKPFSQMPLATKP
jgi:hypothetical protein